MKKLMRMLKVLAAVVAGVVAIGANAETFLEKLAADSHKVDSSPYASGGDIILQLGEDEYVHVFTNTAAAATFTPSVDLKARILVVGGGGSGGSGWCGNGGGGGAGGLLERTATLAASMPLVVVVGAGGECVTAQNTTNKAPGNKGGNSSIGEYSAPGGGYGGSYNSSAGGAGGSGGGSGGTDGKGGAGTEGYGHDGGAMTQNMRGGGGGGAGSAGGDGTSAGSGAGGDGLEVDILGYAQAFAGGGGGAGYNDSTLANCAQGGMGGGGRGSYGRITGEGNVAGRDRTERIDNDAVAGTDGLGGGGGGATDSQYSGKGGDGIVIVRYNAYSGSSANIVSCEVVMGGPRSLSLTGKIDSIGVGASSATITFSAAPTAGQTGKSRSVTVESNVADPDAMGHAFSGLLTSLTAATTYEWALTVENNLGNTATKTGTITLTDFAPVISGDVDASVLSGGDKLWVFTNGIDHAVFTPNMNVTLRAMLIGGGGSGGSGWCGAGGGGGAGGLMELDSLTLKAGVSYEMAVGLGGASVTATNTTKGIVGNHGEATRILRLFDSGATPTVETSVIGGGGGGAGGSGVSSSGLNGASGGGGAEPGAAGGAGTAGLGNDGGSVPSSGAAFGSAGGGGGAGAKGGDATATGGGVGGAGLKNDFLGETIVFCGGGGAGGVNSSTAATAIPGGAGGGGRGSYGRMGTGNVAGRDRTERIDNDAVAGTDGLGGGGGGATDSQYSGKGGDGLIALRYTPIALSDAPIVMATWGEADLSSVSVTANLVDAGDAESADIYAVYGYAADSLDVGKTRLASGFGGHGEFTLAGLAPGRIYYVALVADNGNETDNVSTSAVTAVTTESMFSQELTYTSAGGVLGYTVDGAAAADSQRLELWVGPDAASMTNQATYTDASLLAAGAHTIQPFAAEQFVESVAILLRHVAVVGARAFTNDTAVLSTTLLDGATYTWKSDVAEGDWCDAANWTALTTPGRGWPTAGSTAKFPNMTSTVRVDRAVSFSTANFSGGTWSFAGTTSGASLSFGGSGDACLADGSYRFDALAVCVSAGQNGWLGGNQRIVLENGAALFSSKNLCLRAAGGSLLIGAGCSFEGNSLGGSKGAALVVSNGTATVSGAVNLSERGSATDLPASLSICGADARIFCSGLYSQNTNATVTIELEGTYSSTEALIRETGTTVMAASGGTLTFDVPRTRASKSVAKCDILVADWSKKSINTELVAFGEHEKDDCSYFFFTESADLSSATRRYTSVKEVADAGATVKYLWYHHKGPGGFRLSVR